MTLIVSVFPTRMKRWGVSLQRSTRPPVPGSLKLIRTENSSISVRARGNSSKILALWTSLMTVGALFLSEKVFERKPPAVNRPRGILFVYVAFREFVVSSKSPVGGFKDE